ncbi:MAG: threonine synthase [Elusimicrobia bacterium CG1_02_37_114]|nr:MAG: threonine synthase [Elusimicrobia bacterium CG1_02_37_114]PIV53653.1 MAG: threonine synthase [Elusimicrobia bacterium CG02_land_8_20_14_3_00_37_13]PIZ13470.1 MAG: threonine synthase [Elusimicrobia bacterium CG_4_10_14_0_8_um_filter_37_32]
MIYKGVIERYREFLPVSSKTPVITMYEGNTPLLRAVNLERRLGLQSIELYLKCEGFNPTGSFKDRGMTVAVSKAVEEGAKAVMCASTGNTSASAAAYSSRSGLKCIVLIPEGAIALGKLSQAMIHNAEVVAVRGNFDTALNLAREICEKYPVTLVNSINPYRIEGQKTASFEIVDSLGRFPDYQFMPVGNAGNITAYWKGYKEYQKVKHSDCLPKMMGFQASGSAPIVLGKPIKNPETIATAIRIGNPASWKKAVEARDESGGVIDTVTDKEIITAYKLIAGTEGIFVEPASASSVAGLLKYVKKGYFSEIKSKETVTVVCILTGHGLKDPDRAIKSVRMPKVVSANLKSVLKVIRL